MNSSFDEFDYLQDSLSQQPHVSIENVNDIYAYACEVEVETGLSSLNSSVDQPIPNEIFDEPQLIGSNEHDIIGVEENQRSPVIYEKEREEHLTDDIHRSPLINSDNIEANLEEIHSSSTFVRSNENVEENLEEIHPSPIGQNEKLDEIHPSRNVNEDRNEDTLEEISESPQVNDDADEEESCHSPSLHESATIFYSKSTPGPVSESTDQVSFTWVNPKKEKPGIDEIFSRKNVQPNSPTKNVVQTTNLHSKINIIKNRKEKRSWRKDNEDGDDDGSKRFKQSRSMKLDSQSPKFTPKSLSKLSVLDQCVQDLDDIDMRLKRLKKQSMETGSPVHNTINDVINNVFTSSNFDSYSEPRKPKQKTTADSRRSLGNDVNSVVVELASGWFKCNWCDFKRPKKSAVQIHLRNVHCERVPCYLCTQTFSSAKSLQMHIVSVHQGLKPFECEFCGQKFPKKHSMLRHVSLVHDRSQLIPVTCSICGNEYPSEDHLKTHILHVHDTAGGPDRRKFPCKICGAIYLWRSSLQKHYQSMHLEQIQRGGNISCSLCNRKFIDEKGLRLHNLTHAKKNELILKVEKEKV